MRYTFLFLFLVIFMLVSGCSGSNSPLENDLDGQNENHLASIDVALEGVDVLNTISLSVSLNGVKLTPWGMIDLSLPSDDVYSLEILTDNPDVEVEMSVENATLILDNQPVETYTGSARRTFSITSTGPEIQIHLNTKTQPAHMRDIIVRTVESEHLPIPPQPATVQYSDPETGLSCDIAEREMIVGFEPGTPVEVVVALVDTLDSEILRAIPRIDAYRIRIPSEKSYASMSKLFMESVVVKYAEINSIKYLDFIPNDTYESQEYDNVVQHQREAWDIHTGTDSTLLCLIDSGAMRDHPDLAANIVDGEDFINPIGDGLGGETPGNGLDEDNDGYPDGNVGHGSHCSGIMGAVGNNSEGVSGHSWATHIMPLRVFPIDGDSGASDSAIAEAITYAADHGAHGISMSLGGSFGSNAELSAITYAWNNGSVIVAAAGNSNSSQPHYPSSFPNVVSVAATDEQDHKANFSNYGTTVDVSACGVEIVSSIFYVHSGDPLSVPEIQRYDFYSGTSMACPQVTGLVALVKSYFPSYTNSEIVDQIIYTADNIDAQNPGYEGLLGSGRINDFRALTTPLEADFEITEISADDDNPLYSQGNRDGFINPGEIFEFYPQIRNIGLKSASNVILSLETSGGLIESMFTNISLGNINKGQVVTPTDPVIFRISDNAQDNDIVNLTLQFDYTGGEPIELEYPLTIRKDNQVVDTISFYGENMFGVDLAKGTSMAPALKITIEGDLNYGTLEELTFHQTGTADEGDLGELQLWLDANDDGIFSQLFDTRLAYHSYNHPGYRGEFDMLNDPEAGFGVGVGYEDFDPVYFNSSGLAIFREIILPTAPGFPRTMFVVLTLLPTAVSGHTVQIGLLSSDDVHVKSPDVVNPADFPIQSALVPIIGRWLDPWQITDNPGTTSWRAETDVCPVTGNVYVVFDSNREGNFDVFIKRSTNLAETFEDDLMLDGSSANEWYPSVAVDSAGVVHVVYYSNKIANNNREIYYTRSIDFGVSFSVPVRLTEASGDSRIPKIRVDSNDNLHIAWHDNRPGNPDYNIYYKSSVDGGLNWGADIRVANTANESEEAAIAIGGDGVIHITWEEGSGWYGGNTFYSRSIDNGASWSTVFQITTGAYNNRGTHSDVAADNSGNVYVAFHYTAQDDAEISMRVSHNSGANFDPVINITDNTLPDSRPGINILPDGSYVDIVFRQRVAGVWNIWHTYSTDGLATWNEPVQISLSTGGGASEPVIVRDSNKNAFAFWHDIVSAQEDYEVFGNRFLY